MNRISSRLFILVFIVLLLSSAASIFGSKRVASEVKADASVSSTSTIFSEGFEWTFPEPSWFVADDDAENGRDYWDDTSIRSHGGSYSAWCAQTGDQLSAGETVFSQDFEGVFPTSEWGIWDLNDDAPNGEDYWNVTNYRSHGGNRSAWCAQVGVQLVGFDYVENYAVHKYDDKMDSGMGGFVSADHTDRLGGELGYAKATLSFSYWLDCESEYDYLRVECSGPMPATPIYLANYTGNSGGWKSATVDVDLFARGIDFVFESDGSNHNFEGAYIDDIVLTGYRRVQNWQVGKYDDNMEAGMLRMVDLTPYSSVTLSYWYWASTEQLHDYLKVMCYLGSISYLDPHTGSSNGWQYAEVSIPTAATYVGFIFSSDSSNHNYEGVYVDDVLLVGTEKTQPTIESCDQTGTWKDSFDIADTSYVTGSGYTPLATYNVYVVSDTSWADGMSIPQRVSGTILSMTLDASGNFSSSPTWFSPLTPGEYDIIVDVNNNTRFDSAIDALDDNDVNGNAGFSVTEQEMRQLSISVYGPGSTDPAIGTNLYSNGTEVPVQANPIIGWRLDHWMLDGIYIEQMNPIPVTMGKDRNLMAVFVGAPPTLESCDRTGVNADQFTITDDVYVTGAAYSPLIYYDVYVVGDVEWTDGMTIPARVLGTVESVLSDLNGNMQQALVWGRPLTEATYDICIDVNGNGKYDQEIDALDDNDIEVTAGFVIPEFSFIVLALFIIATLLAAIACGRKRLSGLSFRVR